MFELSQKDLRWVDDPIGRSAATVGDYGCTITAICIIANMLAGHEVLTPDVAAQAFRYNLKGEIIWKDSDFDKFGIRFVKRGYGYNKAAIEDAVISKNKMVILEVNHRAHWITATQLDHGEIAIIDPADGQKYSKIPSKYVITGYAIFENVDADIPNWAQTPWNKGKNVKGLYDGVDPQDERTLDDLQGSLVKLGKINKVAKMPAYREAAFLEKLGLLD